MARGKDSIERWVAEACQAPAASRMHTPAAACSIPNEAPAVSSADPHGRTQLAREFEGRTVAGRGEPREHSLHGKAQAGFPGTRQPPLPPTRAKSGLQLEDGPRSVPGPREMPLSERLAMQVASRTNGVGVAAADSLDYGMGGRGRRKRRASSENSILEPAVISRPPQENRPSRADYKRGRRGKVVNEDSEDDGASRSGRDSSSSSAGSSVSPQDETKYTRLPRHKTRPDKYEVKIGKKSDKYKRGLKEKRAKKKRGKDPSLHGVAGAFTAENVTADRLTMKPTNSLGLFKRGRASSPVWKRGLPDLAFSEMSFLQRRRDTTRPQLAEAAQPTKRRKKDHESTEQEEISSYFQSTKSLAEDHGGSHVNRPHREFGADSPHRHSPSRESRQRGRDIERRSSTMPSIELPEKPYLGFGTRGADLSSPVRRAQQTPQYSRFGDSSPVRPPSNITWSASPERLASNRTDRLSLRKCTSARHTTGSVHSEKHRKLQRSPATLSAGRESEPRSSSSYRRDGKARIEKHQYSQMLKLSNDQIRPVEELHEEESNIGVPKLPCIQAHATTSSKKMHSVSDRLKQSVAKDLQREVVPDQENTRHIEHPLQATVGTNIIDSSLTKLLEDCKANLSLISKHLASENGPPPSAGSAGQRQNSKQQLDGGTGSQSVHNNSGVDLTATSSRAVSRESKNKIDSRHMAANDRQTSQSIRKCEGGNAQADVTQSSSANGGDAQLSPRAESSSYPHCQAAHNLTKGGQTTSHDDRQGIEDFKNHHRIFDLSQQKMLSRGGSQGSGPSRWPADEMVMPGPSTPTFQGAMNTPRYVSGPVTSHRHSSFLDSTYARSSHIPLWVNSDGLDKDNNYHEPQMPMGSIDYHDGSLGQDSLMYDTPDSGDLCMGLCGNEDVLAMDHGPAGSDLGGAERQRAVDVMEVQSLE